MRTNLKSTTVRQLECLAGEAAALVVEVHAVVAAGVHAAAEVDAQVVVAQQLAADEQKKAAEDAARAAAEQKAAEEHAAALKAAAAEMEGAVKAVTEAAAGRVVSLPMHPDMPGGDIDRVVAAVTGFRG